MKGNELLIDLYDANELEIELRRRFDGLVGLILLFTTFRLVLMLGVIASLIGTASTNIWHRPF